MFRLFRKGTIIVLCLLCLIPAGVSATWLYASNPATGMGGEVTTNIIPFKYKPEEILPTDLNANQMKLIDSIVNHLEYGFNATKKSLIREELEAGAGIVYGDQVVQKGNLTHLFLKDDEVKKLMFAVTYYSDNEYHIYTFLLANLTQQNVGEQIEVYKTICKKETIWEAVTSFKGKAEVCEPAEVPYSIDPETWVYG